jgi:hypothetical protein
MQIAIFFIQGIVRIFSVLPAEGILCDGLHENQNTRACMSFAKLRITHPAAKTARQVPDYTRDNL